jgi:predicted dehydrogenase
MERIQNRVNVVLIGCGRIAGYNDNPENLNKVSFISHARAVRENDFFNLVACIDVELEKAKHLAKLYSVSVWSDNLESVLNSHKVDIVTVCTPDQTHYEVVTQVLNTRSRPSLIFLEKPACLNNIELDQMKQLAEKRGVRIIVNHSRRFSSQFRVFKKLILDGEFGDLVKVRGINYGGFLHNGVHFVDTLEYLFNESLVFNEIIESVPSTTKNDYDGFIQFNLEQSGIPVRLDFIQEIYYQLFEFDFWFTKSRVRIEDFGNRIIIERKKRNHLGENILVEDKNDILPQNSNSALSNALQRIGNFYLGLDDLRDVDINSIGRVMQLTWNTFNKLQDELK